MVQNLHQNSPELREKEHGVLYLLPNAEDRPLSKIDPDREVKRLEASSAHEGLQVLRDHGASISCIVMSYFLPDMEGVEFLRTIKRNLDWNYIPTLVITSDINENNLVESVNAGAFYYLERPFGDDVFVSVMNKALKDYTTYLFYLSKAQNVHIARLVDSGRFRFQTFKEGYEVADWLASLCLGRARDDIVVGFIELLINAVEHGNLEVGYEEKTAMMKEGDYLNRLVERLAEPKYRDRYVTVEFHREHKELVVNITDEGKGFDSAKYMVMDKSRLFHSHGKGILMAKNLYFSELEYNEKGNSVTVRVS